MRTKSIKDLMIKHLKIIMEMTYPYQGKKKLQQDKIDLIISLSDTEFFKEYNNLLKQYHTWG